MHTPVVTRKPLTQEQALERWHREAVNVQRIIDEGKALNSIAARLYPRRQSRPVPRTPTGQIASAPAQQRQSAPNSIASALYPGLRER
jgi:hypothetical protein